MQTRCELPGPAGIGRVPRLLRFAAPTLSARGQGRTGLGTHPIPATGNSARCQHLTQAKDCATPTQLKEIALCDDDRHDN